MQGQAFCFEEDFEEITDAEKAAATTNILTSMMQMKGKEATSKPYKDKIAATPKQISKDKSARKQQQSAA